MQISIDAFSSLRAGRLARPLAGLCLVASASLALAQAPAGTAQAPGLPAPMTQESGGAIINQVPRTRGITEPIAVPPVTAAPQVPQVVAPPRVDPAAGVVPPPPGAPGPVLRPEIGRSGIDALQTPAVPARPQGRVRAAQEPAVPGQLSPAEAAQRQLMIEREDRVRGLAPRAP